MVRRRLPRLPVAVRDRRGVHQLRRGQQRPVRHHQGAPARAAGRQRRGQRAERQGRARGDVGRPGLLRRQRRRRQHRRDREVPLHRGAGLALDRRQRLPRRDVCLRQAQHALHLPRARRRPRRLARRARQRRGVRHGHREARQHRLHDPGPARPRRPRRQQARHRDAALGDRQGGRPRASLRRDVVERQGHQAVRRLAGRPRQHEGLPAALDRRHAGRGGAEATRPSGRTARTAGPRPDAGPAARTPLLHRHVRPVPHRLREDRADRRHRGSGLRQRHLERGCACARCSR